MHKNPLSRTLLSIQLYIITFTTHDFGFFPLLIEKLKVVLLPLETMVVTDCNVIQLQQLMNTIVRAWLVGFVYYSAIWQWYKRYIFLDGDWKLRFFCQSVLKMNPFFIHSHSVEEGQLMSSVRTSLQTIFPVCGDLLLGETRIRRVPLGEVNVPQGAHVLISNNRHAFTPSAPKEMRLRRDALLDQDFSYHLFNLNCEHFATFVRYGKAVCNQV